MSQWPWVYSLVDQQRRSLTVRPGRRPQASLHCGHLHGSCRGPHCGLWCWCMVISHTCCQQWLCSRHTATPGPCHSSRSLLWPSCVYVCVWSL